MFFFLEGNYLLGYFSHRIHLLGYLHPSSTPNHSLTPLPHPPPLTNPPPPPSRFRSATPASSKRAFRVLVHEGYGMPIHGTKRQK